MREGCKIWLCTAMKKPLHSNKKPLHCNPKTFALQLCSATNFWCTSVCSARRNSMKCRRINSESFQKIQLNLKKFWISLPARLQARLWGGAARRFRSSLILVMRAYLGEAELCGDFQGAALDFASRSRQLLRRREGEAIDVDRPRKRQDWRLMIKRRRFWDVLKVRVRVC